MINLTRSYRGIPNNQQFQKMHSIPFPISNALRNLLYIKQDIVYPSPQISKTDHSVNHGSSLLGDADTAEKDTETAATDAAEVLNVCLEVSDVCDLF